MAFHGRDDRGIMVGGRFMNTTDDVMWAWEAGALTDWTQTYWLLQDALDRELSPMDTATRDVFIYSMIGVPEEGSGLGGGYEGETDEERADRIEEERLAALATGGENVPYYSPYTDYLTRAGLLGGGQDWRYTPAQQYRESLYPPIQEAQQLEQRFGGALGLSPRPIEDYLGANVSGFVEDPRTIYAGASNILRQLLGMGAGGRAQAGVTFSPRWTEEGGMIQGDVGMKMGEGQAGQLMQQALRGFGGGRKFAQRFAGRMPEEQHMWEQQRATGLAEGGTNQFFLDWLAAKYPFLSRTPGEDYYMPSYGGGAVL
jgi:hypothetical protein